MTVSARPRPVELPPQPGAARRVLARLLGEAAWPGDIDGALLAMHEAMVNAAHHGGGVTRATAGLDGSTLVVEVADRGRGFDLPASPALADGGAERGRGLFLIRHLSSAAWVVRAGPEVRLVLTFAP
ncbi:MAG: ATP-binding protein [Acidimicrobiales bacterium]